MTQESPLARIAMWSGPRNLSTTLMRSFGARQDCMISDEPFYAAYLKITGEKHPMADEIMAYHETDADVIAAQLASETADPDRSERLTGQKIWYQKHMCHHMVAGIPKGWMRGCNHAFLIRHPRKVLASFAVKHHQVSLRDVGYPDQLDLFKEIADQSGKAPPVILSDDVLAHPAYMLEKLCKALGIAYSDQMLRWPKGRWPEDGIWGSHWYDRVWESDGFAVRSGPISSDQVAPSLSDRAHAVLPDPLRSLEEKATDLFDQIAVHRLTPPEN